MASHDSVKGPRFLHTGLRVADIDRSIAFYSGILGIKELGRMVLKTATLVFLGYPDATTPDTPLVAREGVLELVSSGVKDSSKTTLHSSSHSAANFIKLAFNVPDISSAMEELKRENFKVVKEAGVSDGPQEVASFLGCKALDLKSDGQLQDALEPVCFVQDPDGNLVEIVQM